MKTKAVKIAKEELWSLDMTIAAFVAPRLKALSKIIEHPAMPDMVQAFDLLSQEPVFELKTRKDQIVIRRGLRLFSKHLPELWF